MTVTQRIHEVEAYIEILQIQAYKHFENNNKRSHKVVSDIITDQKKDLEKLNAEFHSEVKTNRVRNVIYN